MVEPNDSSSVTNTDCSKLEELLQAGKWREADMETLAIMLRATNREQEGWLDLEHIQQFPDSELNTINRLWVNHSNGHFGFSVQKSLWQGDFFWNVGWLKTLSWANGSQGRIESEVIYDITAPQGHLPRCILINSFLRDGVGDYSGCWWGSSNFGLKYGGSYPMGRKQRDADYSIKKVLKNYRNDLECILSRQYLE